MRYKNQGLVVSWYDALREVRAAATAGVVQDPIKNGAVPRRTAHNCMSAQLPREAGVTLHTAEWYYYSPRRCPRPGAHRTNSTL